MKIRIYNPEKDSEKNLWIPTGFLFTKVGMYFAAKMMSSQARKEYDKKIDEMWKSSGDAMDDLISMDDVEAAERLTPPITEEQARELFTALKDAKYLMHGLPLVSIETAEGLRLRVDL
ncbi:MAG: hypothetical protein IJ438_05700 [Clostridia bacterium]|nr:hypothetical protein [Clostridia bacterium]